MGLHKTEKHHVLKTFSSERKGKNNSNNSTSMKNPETQNPMPAGEGGGPPVVIQEEGEGSKIEPPPHPIAMFFHLAFRTLAVISYLLLSYLVQSFVIAFIVVVLLLALDFWTVKNVTGRLLVGLRWWNEIKEDGTTEWIFESHQGRRNIHRMELGVFWGSLFGFMVIWVIFLLTCVFWFEPKWMIVVIVAMVMNGANLVGYIRCAKEQRSQLKQAASGAASGYISRQIAAQAKNRLFNLFGGGDEAKE